jgi:hypothetical protein
MRTLPVIIKMPSGFAITKDIGQMLIASTLVVGAHGDQMALV